VTSRSSRKAAERAWGVHQNLFELGEARIATDDAAAAALDHPGETLRRPVGSTGPYQLQPTGLPRVPEAPRRAAKPKPRAKSPPSKRPADRSKLDSAEAALRKLNDKRLAEEASLAREADALEAKRAAAQVAYVAAHRKAGAAVAAARQAYRKAGGEA
jgi:hypothetical protein